MLIFLLNPQNAILLISQQQAEPILFKIAFAVVIIQINKAKAFIKTIILVDSQLEKVIMDLAEDSIKNFILQLLILVSLIVITHPLKLKILNKITTKIILEEL